MTAFQDVLEHLLTKSQKAKWITAWRHIHSKPAELRPFPGDIHSRLIKALSEKGIKQLYTHQEETYRQVQLGRHPIIITPTASGKTLCYNLPVLDRIMKEPRARALYVFPTKALAHDQFNELKEYRSAVGNECLAGTYDGDTGSESRQAIRKACSIVVTNPDMIHTGILPHHPKWHTFLSNLEFVVIDELHSYRGVFGSHLCNIIRRLDRICNRYGSHPTYILCSATLANPKELAEKITGKPVTVIDRSGAPTGERIFIFYNPPVVDRTHWIRRSYLMETVDIAKPFIESGLQTIIFARSRLNVEILVQSLRRLLSGALGDDAVRGYRSGYLAAERRQIESGLREGSIAAVVATSALEVGVDIGNLAVAILSGYPGSVASTWQRAGRAGRRDAPAAAIFIASSAPLDQFIVRNPEYFFDASPEHALVNPDNLLILLEHIRCAAFEIPFESGESFGNSQDTEAVFAFLEEEGDLINASGKWHYSGQNYPAAAISLRSASPERIAVLDRSLPKPALIAEIDAVSATYHLHPHAIYLHEGRKYRVVELNFEQGKAYVESVETEYFTMPVEHSRVRVLDLLQSTGHPFPANYGEVQVISHVVGYKQLKFQTFEQIAMESLELPEKEMITTSFWITFQPDRTQWINPPQMKDLVAGMAGALTAIHNIASILLMCEPHDLGSCVADISGSWSAQTNHLGMVELSIPADMIPQDSTVNMFVYDRCPGGIGLSEQLFKLYSDLIESAHRLVSTCDCYQGCPGCVGPVTSESKSVKTSALRIIQSIRTELVR